TSALQKSLLQVMEPFHPDDFYTSYIDARDFLDAKLEEDEVEREYLLEDSNFDVFLTSLQKLIDTNKITAKLTTPLHKTVEILEKAYNHLTTEDALHRDMIEILRRKNILIKNAMI